MLTFGEGWHNNHHHHPTAARQGVAWWELDITYGALRALAALRIVHGLRQPTPAALTNRRIDVASPDAASPEPRSPTTTTGS
jgi:stearoyl-CoA desaturase (delta-9 desaturase)